LSDEIGSVALVVAFLSLILALAGFIFPSSDSPFDRRYLYEPQGTLADIRTLGTGYERSNSYVWYRVLNTGTGAVQNYIYCCYGIPEDSWKDANAVREIECGIANRDSRVNENAVLMLGSGGAIVNQFWKDQTGNEYCAFWLIGNTTYRGELKIYARTQKGTDFQEDYITFISYGERRILRIETDKEEIRYYIDNVLEVTHTPYSWVASGAPYAKTGIWNNQPQDASIVFYPLTYYSDY